MIVSLLPGHIGLTVQVGKQVAYTEVGREGLETIIFQLFVNARGAMPNGGQQTIEVKTIEDFSKLARPASTNMAVPPDSHSSQRIGTGMSLDTQDHMFEHLFPRKKPTSALVSRRSSGLSKKRRHVGRTQSTGPRNRRPGRVPCGPGAGARRNDPKDHVGKEVKRPCLWRETASNGSWHCLPWRRHRYRALEAASSVEAR